MSGIKSRESERVAPLSRAFDARHVAVFGASSKVASWGYLTVNEVLKAGYGGKLTLVNPRGGEVFGQPLVSAEHALGADVAVLATPAETIPGLVRQCGELGIGTAVVHAARFGEIGNFELQQKLIDAGREANVRIIGPNCVGFYCSTNKLNVTLTPGLPPGKISVVTQSGGVALQAGHRFAQLGDGFDVMLAFGNKLDIGFKESVAAIAERDTTESLMLYLERLDEGDEFLDVLAKVTPNLPIVALLAGQTEAGRRATASHTGSLIGNWGRSKALLEEAGVTVVDRLEAAAAMAVGSRRARVRGRRTYVIADGGGPSVLLSDALGRAGFDIPPPSAALQNSLSEMIDARIAQSNPLDFQGTSDEDPSLLDRALEKVLQTEEYDIVVFAGLIGGISYFYGPTFEEAENNTMRRIVEMSKTSGIPVVVQSHYATDGTGALKILRDGGIPCLEWADEVMHSLIGRLPKTPFDLQALKQAHAPKTYDYDTDLAAETERLVTLFDAQKLPHALGHAMTVDDTPEAGVASWVLRLDGIAHKTAMNAIEVGVKPADLKPAIKRLTKLGAQWTTNPVVRAAPFLPHDEEILLTFFRDPQEGTGFVLGAGGTKTESLQDVAVGRLPKSTDDVLRVLERSRLGKQIIADSDIARLNQLAAMVLRLAQIFSEDLPELAELEINPLAMTDEGPVVLDVLPAWRSK